MSEYTPDKWVILRLTEGDSPPIDKVFAGWVGGYLTEDSWKLNSGIKKITATTEGWDVLGHTGSVYHCRRYSEGLTGYMGMILSGWEQSQIKVEQIAITFVVPS